MEWIDTIASVSTVLTVPAALLGILSWLITMLRKRGGKEEIILEVNHKKFEIPSDLSSEELQRLLEIIKESPEELRKKEASTTSAESGFVTPEFLLFVVPGIIALLFAGTFIYLLVVNQNNPNYATPKELSAAMTTIMGYYFGVGASAAANKSKTTTLSTKDVKDIIAKHKQ